MRTTSICILFGVTACVALRQRLDPVRPVEYMSRVTVTAGGSLNVGVVARNRSTQVIQLEEGSQCRTPQPLVMRYVPTGRVVLWDERAWRRTRPDTVYCVDASVLHRLAPDDSVVLTGRSYPLQAIIGDSLARGWYDVGVGLTVLIRRLDDPPATRPDTVVALDARLRLP